MLKSEEKANTFAEGCMTPSQQALTPRLSTTLDSVQEILGALVARYRTDEVLTSVRQIPAREAKFRPVPDWVRSGLSAAYRAKGINELYSHQAATAELVHSGRNVVVVTPTASGKTLCYNLPVLNAVLENPDTRALYLFPTKALAQDQLAELHDLAKRLDDCFGVFTYDGDTPNDARKAIRERGHVVLTNPDMLHTGILPHHTKWMRLFENLRYIVLDELHTYRGVFGSHLANVLRRLRRVARFYGSNPQFICCSATIANPGELASQLIESEADVVEENGAPAGEQLFVFYNPPMVNRNLGIRRSYINEATRVAKELLARKLQTIVFANSRLHTEVMLTYLQKENPPKPGQAEPVRGYRGGYLPQRPPNKRFSRSAREERESCGLQFGFRVRTKVNSLWPNPELVIALHSPSALLETGLHLCPTEKDLDIASFDPKQSVLCSPVCLRLIAKYGHHSRISQKCGRTFSALQTAWRRGRDSKLYSPIQPLTSRLPKTVTRHIHDSSGATVLA